MQESEVLDYIKQAFELKNQGCYKQAIEMLYKTLETEIDNIEILYQLGELYFQLHNYARAEKYLEKVLLKNSSHVESYKLLEEIYIRQGELKNAKTAAEKVFALEGTSKNLAALIRILSSLKEYEEIEKYISSMHSDKDVMYEYALSYYVRKEPDKALEIIESSGCDCDEAEILKGKILFEKKDYEKSKEIFKKLERVTESDEVLNYLGLFKMDEGDYTEAVKYFSKASALNKNKSVYYYNLGNAYYLNGWFSESAASYKKAIGLEVDNADYRYSLGYLYYSQKEFEKAENEVKYILSSNPEHIETKVLKALLKYENKDYLGAKIILEECLSKSVDNDFAKSALAKVYTELLIFDKAEKLFNELVEKFPQNVTYMCDFADLCIKEKKYDDAISIIEKVIEENENYLEAYALGAKASLQKGDLTKAKEYAQNAIALDINCASGYYYLSLVRAAEEDYEEAIECMKRAIFHDINNPEYYASMSRLYKDKGDVKSAFEYIKEAQSLNQTSEEYKNTYKELAAQNRK